jgi:hypothetical protein
VEDGGPEVVGSSQELRPRVSLVPTHRAEYLRAYPWLGYEGRWGEEHEGFYNGPTGPNTKLQWHEPITWANDEWRDRSFVVPVGSSAGSTATGFFCGAVAAGSSLLTALVGNPSPVLIALAVLLVVLLWLTSRTRWQPSAPFRVVRRRPWGAIVNAGRRMYVHHLGLFLGIGLLFFPVGALISVLQYLLFHASGLDALVDSAGETNALVDGLAIGLGVVLTVFGLAIVQSATSIAMVELDAGREITALGAYRKALPKLGSLLGATLIAVVVIAIVDLTAVGLLLGIWLAVRWAFLAQVITLGGTSTSRRFRPAASSCAGTGGVWRRCCSS